MGKKPQKQAARKKTVELWKIHKLLDKQVDVNCQNTPSIVTIWMENRSGNILFDKIVLVHFVHNRNCLTASYISN